MKVCILSMQHVQNYGSVLQAYSLKKIIENLGHNVEFIEIKRGENVFLNMQCDALAQEDNLKENSWMEKQFNRVIDKIEGRKSATIFKAFQSNYLNLGKNKNKNYDVCVIGSDEVFNCLQKSKWGFDPQLFGKVEIAKKVITYAASCGATRVELLSRELRGEIANCMSNIKSISVRDKNTANFVKVLTGSDVVFSLDPVAVGDFSEEICQVKMEHKLPNRYCILYSYKNRISDKNEIDKIQNYCKKNNLDLIAPFGKQKWIKKHVPELTPFELLKAFENAESVITDTFHGALFGVKFAKNLAVIIRDSNRNKLEDLTTRLGIEKHVLTNMDNLENILNFELEKTRINSLLQTERNRTMEYLKENLDWKL